MDLYYQIAEVCHEANRAYRLAMNEPEADGYSRLPWSEAPEWQRYSVIQGVKFKAEFPLSTPADSHQSWLIQKQNDGWMYGPEKNVELKMHPCMVEYDELPAEQRAKDHIFQAIAGTLLRQHEENTREFVEALKQSVPKNVADAFDGGVQHDGQG